MASIERLWYDAIYYYVQLTADWYLSLAQDLISSQDAEEVNLLLQQMDLALNSRQMTMSSYSNFLLHTVVLKKAIQKATAQEE